MVAFSGKTMAQTYDPVAVTVINNLIDSNGLTGYAKDQPDTWDFAVWSEDSLKQLIELDFYSVDIFDLTGAASFAGLSSLKYLDCFRNNLTALDLTGCTKLEYLDCSYNLLTELDASDLTSIVDLDCYSNILTELNVNGCTNLEYLDCEDNSLVQLDVTQCINLEGLYCPRNNLTQLDVPGLTSLIYLVCYENLLTELKVSGCTGLEQLDCENNSLTALDLTDLDSLYEFYGDYQEVSLELDKNLTCNILLNNPTFDKNAITYSSGVLTSSDNSVASTYFTVETGLSGHQIRGMMYFDYGNVGIAETDNYPYLRVYPNPVNEQLTISTAGGGKGVEELTIEKIEIYDVVGQCVFTTPSFGHPSKGGESSTSAQFPSEGGAGVVIDVSHLAAGMYFLKVNNKVAKIIKN